MRILLAGAHTWADHDLIRTVLAEAHLAAGGGEVTLVHGDCPSGADQIADTYWRRRGLPVETHPADWGTYGRSAATIRNQSMVNLGAMVCLGFPLGRSAGTRECIQLARRAGIPTFVFEG